MYRARLLLASLLLGFAAGCSGPRPQPQTSSAQVRAVDGSGRALRTLQVGSTLFADARGLEPNRMYELRLSMGEDVVGLPLAVSFARVGSDAEGRVPPIALWYESGVVGSAPRSGDAKLPPHTFRSFDEADRSLRDKTLTLSVHPVGEETAGKKSPLEPAAGEAVAVQHLKVSARQSPMVYASDEKGGLLNAGQVGAADLYVSGLNFEPGEEVALAVVPDRREWHIADPIDDVTGDRGEPEMKTVQVGKDGRFTARVWGRARQRRGTFDLVAHRNPADARPRIGARDVISYSREVGLILYQSCPGGCLCLDMAGRPAERSGAFEPTHAFGPGEPVYAALDPTFVPDGHPGGRYAAFYVVRHQPLDPAAAARDLEDVTGGAEVVPVKAGSISTTEVPVWLTPLPPGQYDLVATFGDKPGEAAAFNPDGKYHPAADFVDGGGEAGFVVAEDPYDLGTTPVGRAEYSVDDFFRRLGGARDVDLRAVVRYPATAAGDATPVAAGRHPVFVIEHGNHNHCRQNRSHASCTDRVPNHLGYMHLLDALASHGIIAVSIDAYDLTGPVPGWIDERGDLILKHLELWSHLDNPATYRQYPDFFDGRFHGHVDLSKVSVSGHSRGGEASVAAYERNRGVFGINSVSSIAPVDFEGYTLPDVPYFVILPAADGDVADLSGLRIYDRAGLRTGGRGEKSGLYVYGANHNFFNTVWADDNDDSWYPRADYIPKADQQRLGEAYLAAFVRLHLNGEAVYRDMLRGRLTFPSTAGFRLYHMHHDGDHLTLEDGNGREAHADGVDATAVPPHEVSVHATGALRVDWDRAGGRLEYALPGGRDLTPYRALSFRVAQSNAAPPVRGGMDLEVSLREGDKVRATYTGRYAPIPEPYDRHGESYSVMTTVRIPLSSFLLEEPGLSLKHVDRVELQFPSPPKGEVYVDDVELVR